MNNPFEAVPESQEEIEESFDFSENYSNQYVIDEFYEHEDNSGFNFCSIDVLTQILDRDKYKVESDIHTRESIMGYRYILEVTVYETGKDDRTELWVSEMTITNIDRESGKINATFDVYRKGKDTAKIQRRAVFQASPEAIAEWKIIENDQKRNEVERVAKDRRIKEKINDFLNRKMTYEDAMEASPDIVDHYFPIAEPGDSIELVTSPWSKLFSRTYRGEKMLDLREWLMPDFENE